MVVWVVVALVLLAAAVVLRRADRRRGVDAAGLNRSRAVTDSNVDLRRGGGAEGP